MILQTLLNQCQHKLMKCQTPMHAISMFLSALLLNHSLPTRIPMTSVAAQIVVHSCPGFTQTELIPIILSIFNGVPEPFQIFRCQSSSTQVELDLFLRRAATFPIPHLILEVNRLPFQLQEVSLCDVTCCVVFAFHSSVPDEVPLGNRTQPVTADTCPSVFTVY